MADTSIFIAADQGRPVGDPPPGEARISVATLTELMVGVRRAAGVDLRRLRESTLGPARRRAGAMDAIIAATALAHDLAVWTTDGDFAVLAELAPDLRLALGPGGAGPGA